MIDTITKLKKTIEPKQLKTVLNPKHGSGLEGLFSIFTEYLQNELLALAPKKFGETKMMYTYKLSVSRVIDQFFDYYKMRIEKSSVLKEHADLDEGKLEEFYRMFADIIDIYKDSFEIYDAELIEKDTKLALPTIAQKCLNQEAWINDIIITNGLVIKNDNSTIVNDFTELVCSKIAPTANMKISVLLPFNVHYLTALKQISVDEINQGYYTIKLFKDTRDGIIQFETNDKIDITLGKQDMVITFTTIVSGHHGVRSKSVTNFVFQHPHTVNPSDAKIISELRKDVINSLITDGAIDKVDLTLTMNPGKFVSKPTHDNLVLGWIADIHDDMQAIQNSYLRYLLNLIPSIKKVNNHKLFTQVENAILYTIKFKGVNPYPNLFQLIFGFKDIILEYPENIEHLLASINYKNPVGLSAIKLLARSIGEHKQELLFNVDIIHAFMSVDNYKTDAYFGKIIAKYGTSEQIESLLEILINSIKNSQEAEYTRSILNNCKTSFISQEKFYNLSKILQNIQTYKKLFYIVECDKITFKCDDIKQELKKYYMESPQEVRDILDVAMNVFGSQKCKVVFKHNSEFVEKTGTAAHFSINWQEHCGSIYLHNYAQLDKDAWGAFVHEAGHKAMYHVNGNYAKPYNDSNKNAYKNTMDKNVALLKDCSGKVNLDFCTMGIKSCGPVESGVPECVNLNQVMLRYPIAVDLLMMYKVYPREQHDAEEIVRYYQSMIELGTDATNEFFKGMQEWHARYFVPNAVEKELLPEYRLVEIQKLYGTMTSDNAKINVEHLEL